MFRLLHPSQKQMEISPRAHHEGPALVRQGPTVLQSVCYIYNFSRIVVPTDHATHIAS